MMRICAVVATLHSPKQTENWNFDFNLISLTFVKIVIHGNQVICAAHSTEVYHVLICATQCLSANRMKVKLI